MADRDAQTPTPDELIGAGIDALVALRPRALRHIDGGGVYSNIFAGWRAQAALMCRRQADFAKNGRLKFSEGAPLLFLAGSEFDTPSELAATKSVGQVTMTRAASRPGGSIRKGARFARASDSSSQRLWTDAQFECAVDTHVPYGATSVEVPLVAAREGSFANRVYTGVAQTELEIADEIVDRSAWTVTGYEAGGGSDGITDEDLKQYASAFASGQHGPNDLAAIAGAFRAGARHALAVNDPTVAALRLYIADQSWGGSTRWAKMVRQSLYDDGFVGFGCRVLVTFLTNTIVAVEATCRVRSPEYLSETSSIDASIQKALRAYFDTRPDFNQWKSSALRGIVARADRRLLTCTSVSVKELDGTVLSEPAASSTNHYMLLDNSVSVTYLNPT